MLGRMSDAPLFDVRQFEGPRFDDAELEDVNAELRGRAPVRITKPVESKEGRRREAVGWTVNELPEIDPGVAERELEPETLARLRLSLCRGVGPRITASLLERFGSAANALGVSAESLASVDGVGPATVAAMKLARSSDELDQIVHWCHHHDVRLLTLGGDDYPTTLDALPDAPPLLFCRGEVIEADRFAVAVVGTRHATPYGIRQTKRIAAGLARAGVTVVSGLARGVDAAAHESALNAGGRTIAVLGGGMGRMYPPEHTGLAKAIVADGAVLTEHPPMMRPDARFFPQRNRIVAGLSLATLVIEAPTRSGSLITARLAGEMNRDVLALPGEVGRRTSDGCHELIRDGATLVRHVDDILEVLGPLATPTPRREPAADRPTTDAVTTSIRHAAELKLNDVERTVLAMVRTDATLVDVIVRQTELPTHRVLATLTVLEMRRLIRRVPGGAFVRV